MMKRHIALCALLLPALLSAVRARYLPSGVVASCDPGEVPGDIPLLAGKPLVDGQPAVYVCRDSACRKRVTLPGELGSLLARDPPRTD